MIQNKPIVVAIAIIYQEGKFLLQLRDNIPTIVYPGYWALFGGHLEKGETPEEAIKREIKEEIDYVIPTIQKFDCYVEQQLIRHVYYVRLTVGIENLILREGWDFALVSPEIIRLGSCYSDKAKQVRPLAPIHQKILFDFLKSDISSK